MVLCPNCGSRLPPSRDEAARPPPCPACGYRGENAREYFWLYGGGALVILLGFSFGAVGVSLQGAPLEHWSRDMEGWYPIAPWPEEWHWLSFLVTGIVLTLSGMGITRRLWSGWGALVAVASWQTAGSILALSGASGGESAASMAAPLLSFQAVLLLLAARLWLAIRRTPARDPARIREAALRAAASAPREG